MSITYIIPGATLLDQLAPTTLDGLPANDANDDCVPTSIAEGLHILTGGAFDGDELKDAVYGANYGGTQAAWRYIQYCADHGVTLAVHNDSQAGLVATIHAEVAAGHPVVISMPSQWGTAPVDPTHPSGSTHVGIAVGVGADMIRVMNPWHAFYQDESDEWWQARLCYGQVWVMRKADTNVSGVPSGWTDDGVTLRSPDGTPVVRGIRAYLLAHAWDAGNVPVGPEFSVDELELSNTAHGPGVVQFFRFSQLSSAANDHWSVFETWLGAEAKYLRSTLAATQAQLSAAQTTITALKGALASAQAQLSAAQAAEKATSAPPAPPQPTTPPAPVVAPAPPVSASGAASSASTPSVSQGASIMNIFQKAWQGISMTPQERALLRLVEGWLWAGLLAALGVAVTLISSGHLVINQQTLALILGAGFAAIMSAVKKYVSAHGDLLNSLSGTSTPPQS